MRQSGAAKTAFVGLKDNLFSSSLADGLKQPASGTTLVADHRLAVKDDKLDPAEVAAAVANLKQQNPDLIYRQPRRQPARRRAQGADRSQGHAAALHRLAHRCHTGRDRARLSERHLPDRLGGSARRLQRPRAPDDLDAEPAEVGVRRRPQLVCPRLDLGRVQAAARRLSARPAVERKPARDPDRRPVRRYDRPPRRRGAQRNPAGRRRPTARAYPRATTEHLCDRAGQLQGPLRRLVVPPADTRRCAHAVHPAPRAQPGRRSACADAVRAAARRESARRQHALSRHQSHPHLQHRRQRQVVLRRILSVDPRRR